MAVPAAAGVEAAAAAEGALNAEACPWAAEWSSSISSSSRSLRTVWKEGNGYDRLMKIFM
jgi:hypothetical protein